jgi:hypothetical protein
VSEVSSQDRVCVDKKKRMLTPSKVQHPNSNPYKKDTPLL